MALHRRNILIAVVTMGEQVGDPGFYIESGLFLSVALIWEVDRWLVKR